MSNFIQMDDRAFFVAYHGDWQGHTYQTGSESLIYWPLLNSSFEEFMDLVHRIVDADQTSFKYVVHCLTFHDNSLAKWRILSTQDLHRTVMKVKTPKFFVTLDRKPYSPSNEVKSFSDMKAYESAMSNLSSRVSNIENKLGNVESVCLIMTKSEEQCEEIKNPKGELIMTKHSVAPNPSSGGGDLVKQRGGIGPKAKKSLRFAGNGKVYRVLWRPYLEECSNGSIGKDDLDDDDVVVDDDEQELVHDLSREIQEVGLSSKEEVVDRSSISEGGRPLFPGRCSFGTNRGLDDC